MMMSNLSLEGGYAILECREKCLVGLGERFGVLSWDTGALGMVRSHLIVSNNTIKRVVSTLERISIDHLEESILL